MNAGLGIFANNEKQILGLYTVLLNFPLKAQKNREDGNCIAFILSGVEYHLDTIYYLRSYFLTEKKNHMN